MTGYGYCVAFGGVTVADGIVYVDTIGQTAPDVNKGVLFALSAKNGSYLMSPIVFGQPIAGPPVVAEGKVFVETGATNMTGPGWIYALVP